MDIDKQISSLEGNNIFSNDSSSSLKITAIKISCILLISMLVTYIIKPFIIIDIEYDEATQKCSHKIIKKRFFILSFFIFLCLCFLTYYFNINFIL